MNCIECGAGTKVIDSRYKEKTVERRRECLRCGYRFSTREVDRDVMRELRKLKKALNTKF